MKKVIGIVLVLIFCFKIDINAQTGPGGVGNSSGTSSQPTNEIWFDASSLGLSDTDPVANWTDISGNSNDGTQGISANQPTFNTGQINGLPAVIFDGSDDFIPFDGSVLAGKDYTVIYVGQRHSNGLDAVGIGGTNTGANNNLHLYWTGTQFRAEHWSNNLRTNMVTGQTYDGGTVQGTFGIFTTRLGSTEADPQRRNYQNNFYLGGRNNNAQLNSWVGAALARFNDGTAYYSDVDIAEVIIYSTAINEVQLEIVHNYLSEKYGITIDNDRYTAATGYTYNIAGIGGYSNTTHSRASSAGLYVYDDGGSIANDDFLFFSHDNTTNAVSTSDLPGGTVERWERDWYLDKTGTIDAKIIFDLPEGISGGQYAGDINNYVLLYRSGTSGNYSTVTATVALGNADQVEFTVTDGNILDGYYTLGTTDLTNSPVLGVAARTWYALISGDWDNWEVWTLDPSGNLPDNPGHELPSDNSSDKIVIHSGKTVTIPTGNNNFINSSLTVEGRLDVTTTTGHNFTEIRGNGRILMAADNFPAGDATHFYTKGQGEGTVYYYGGSYSLSTTREFYNVVIDLDEHDPEHVVTQLKNYKINGDFTVTSGVWQINDDAATTILDLDVDNDVLVETNGQITVGTGNTIGSYSIPGTMPTSGNYHKIYHQFNIGGNLTNNGSIRMTNQTDPIYNQFTSTGAVTVTFDNAVDKTALLNGITDFYNLIVDKGTDKTYILTINSSNTNNFVLYGANNVGRNQSLPFSSSDPEIRKALWVYHGTLKLTGSINIPTLSEGTSTSPANGNGDYAIGASAGLWIAGSSVTVFSTASDNSTSGNTQVRDGSGSSVTTGSSNQAMSVFGKFRISEGFFGTRNSAGFIFWSAADAQVYIEGGTTDVAQMRGANTSGVASYIQTGGLLRARGNETEAGEYTGSYPLFGLEGTDAVFQMSGGEILLRDEDGDADPEFSIESAAGNYLVTGGKLTINVRNGRSVQISSTANLWDVDIINNTGSGNMAVEIQNDLKVSSDLNLQAYSELEAQADLTLGGDWTIQNNATFIHGSNTVIFASADGEDHNLNIENTTIASVLTLYNVVFNHDDQDIQTTIVSDGRTVAWDNPLAEVMTIEGDLTFLSRGDFNPYRFYVSLKGDYTSMYRADVNTNRGGGGQGRLIMNGTSSQNIKTGRGNIGYLVIDNTNGVVATGDCRMTGTMELANGILDIGTYRFWIAQLNEAGVYNTVEIDVSNYSSTTMIKSAGNKTDGGFALNFGRNTDYTDIDRVFPVGVINYTPMQMDINGIASDSYNNQLTVIPVDVAHPAVTPAASNDALTYYWEIKNETFWGSQFTNPTSDISYIFYYDQSDLQPGYPGQPNDLNSSGPISGYYHPGFFDESITTWSNEGYVNIDGANRTITFNSDGAGLGGFPTGGFTAGTEAAVTGSFPVYYSRLVTGDWVSGQSWSNDPSGEPPLAANDNPGEFNKVIIQNGHTISITNQNQDAYDITINQGGTLDVGTSTGHSFGTIYDDPSANGGAFRIATATLPTADFTPFCATSGATFTYYGGVYTLPNTLDVYPSLRFDSDMLGETKTLPDVDLTINGTTWIYRNAVLKLGTATDGDYNAHRIIIQGKLLFPNSGNRTVVVDGNLHALYNGTNREIDVEDGGDGRHKIIVTRDVSFNRGTFDFYGDGGSTVDLYITDTLRASPFNAVFDNRDYEGGNATHKAEIILNRLIIDKGIDQTTTVTCNTDFALMGATDGDTKALELRSGTFIMDDLTTDDGADTDINLSSGGADFTIPEKAGLEVKLGEVNVYGDNTGIALNGKLTVSGGTVDMVNGAGNGNNYIQYSSSGAATISVTTGFLSVGSQIRRQTNSEQGILIWNQSGGTVVIGQNSAPEDTRGVFEILNTGSSFTHSAGDFTIVRAQTNPSFAAFYFDPETATLTSGTSITIGNTDTPTGQNIGMYINQNLKNLVITGSNNPKATLWTVALTVEENLTIGSGTEFDANGLQLNMQGNFVNNGTFTHNNNLTVFNGSSAQEIQGSSATTFYQLTKNANFNLTLQNDIQIDDDLRIESGTLADNSNEITLLGDIYNVGTHTYGGTGDGITFAGIVQQALEGNGGVYGKLTVDNHNGVKLHVNADEITINNSLKLVDGLFDIGANLLTMQLYALFIEQNPFSTTNMVQTNKSFTDSGIKKYFPSGAGTFTYPIGSGGKYTPVTIIVAQNSSTTGYLVVKASDEFHASITEDIEEPDPEIVDEDNVLQYYWSLKAVNFTDASGTVEMYYDTDDVAVTSPYDVTDYITARLLHGASGSWNKFEWDDFDEGNEKLIFRFATVTDAEITGDYTAGVQPQNYGNGAIPDQVPAFISVANGNWTNVNTWKTFPDGTMGVNVPAGGPKGAIVIIDNGHDVVIDQNYITSYSTEIRGTIAQEDKFGNRLGIVTGTGTILTETGLLPAGYYEEFLSASGGTLDYTGSTDVDILNNITTLNNLRLSGTGLRRWPNVDFTVLGTLEIDGTNSSLNFKNEHFQKMSVYGNITYNSGSFDAGTGATSIVEIAGSVLQTISGTGEFTGINAFNHFIMNNVNGLTLSKPIDIDQTLTFTEGIITTTATNILTLESTDENVVLTAGAGRYVDGPMRKNMSSNSFNFPVGDAGRYGNVSVLSTTITDYWEAEYYNHNPANGAADDNQDMDPIQIHTGTAPDDLQVVSDSEYWRIEAPSSTNAEISLRYDAQSGIPANGDMRIAEWQALTPDAWDDVASNTPSGGVITSNSANISFNKWGNGSFFTLSTTYQPQSFTWEGDVSAAWETNGNWNQDRVPNSLDDIDIPNVANDPVISSTAECLAIDLATGATLTINAGNSLTAYGNFTNAGTLILKSPNSLGAGGSFIDNGTITGTGNVQVERYISKLEYHYVSSPIQSGVSGNANSDLFTSHGSAFNGNFYDYDETIDLDGNASTAPAGAFDPDNLAAGWGFAHNGDGGAAVDMNVKEGYSFYTDIDGVVTFDGDVNTGDMSVSGLPYTDNDPTSGSLPNHYDGWNLVGNPYPSAIDWDLMRGNLTNLDDAIYVWDGTQYANYVSGVTGGAGTQNNEIVPMQSFFVHANANNAGFTLNNSHRVHSTANFKSAKSSPVINNTIKLRLSANNMSDLSVVYFKLNATEEFDGIYDAYRLFSTWNPEVPHLFSITKNEQTPLSISALPENSMDELNIPLGIRLDNGGECVISKEEFNMPGMNVYLIDKLENKSIYLNEENSYSFSFTGGDIRDRFELRTRLNRAPVVESVIVAQAANEDEVFSYTFIENTFVEYDENDRIVSYTATLSDGSALPAWLSFDQTTRTFSGTPANYDVGIISVQLAAIDIPGAESMQVFDIEVVNVNDAPELLNSLSDVQATEDINFEFVFSENTFTDVDAGDVLTYSAKLASGADLPSWLSFNAEARTFTGFPENSDVAVLDIQITATDNDGANVSDIFVLKVVNVNDVPELAYEIPDQEIDEGFDYSYTIPVNTFNDIDPGDELQLSVKQADGSGLPNWLIFDYENGRLYGTAENEGEINIVVTATDLAGAIVSDEYTLTVKSTTGIGGLSASEIIVYPNPTQGEFFVKTDYYSDDLVIIVRDFSGRIIKQEKPESKETKIDISEFSSGMYFIELNDKKESKVFKINLNK